MIQTPSAPELDRGRVLTPRHRGHRGKASDLVGAVPRVARRRLDAHVAARVDGRVRQDSAARPAATQLAILRIRILNRTRRAGTGNDAVVRRVGIGAVDGHRTRRQPGRRRRERGSLVSVALRRLFIALRLPGRRRRGDDLDEHVAERGRTRRLGRLPAREPRPPVPVREIRRHAVIQHERERVLGRLEVREHLLPVEYRAVRARVQARVPGRLDAHDVGRNAFVEIVVVRNVVGDQHDETLRSGSPPGLGVAARLVERRSRGLGRVASAVGGQPVDRGPYRLRVRRQGLLHTPHGVIAVVFDRASPKRRFGKRPERLVITPAACACASVERTRHGAGRVEHEEHVGRCRLCSASLLCSDEQHDR